MSLDRIVRTTVLTVGLAAIATVGDVAFAQSAGPAIEQVQYAPRAGSEPRIRGGVEGRFDYYSMVMSWSPTYCAGDARPGDSQCRPRPRPFAFVLHGLWPQYERGYPEFCPTAERPFVPQNTLDRILDIMPSRNLAIHEYRKHGVCSGLGPEGYFDLARSLFTRIKVPARFVNPVENQFVDTSAVVSEFVAANPGLKPDMLAVVCGGPGNRLREVRVCFTKQGELRSCGNNENARRLCAAPRVFLPPVRTSGSSFAPGRQPPGQGSPGPMLPAPVPSGQRSL